MEPRTDPSGSLVWLSCSLSTTERNPYVSQQAHPLSSRSLNVTRVGYILLTFFGDLIMLLKENISNTFFFKFSLT